MVPVGATEREEQRLGRAQEFLPYLPFLAALPLAAGRKLTFADDPFLVVSDWCACWRLEFVRR